MEFLDRRTLRVLRTLLAVPAVLAVLYYARAIVVLFAFSILFAYLIHPVVRFLQQHSLVFRNLRGPHIVEAYLLFLLAVGLLIHTLAPGSLRRSTRFVGQLPEISQQVASGEIAGVWGRNLGWSDAQSLRVRDFLRDHHSDVVVALRETGRFASTIAGGLFVIPILAMFFLNDGEKITTYFIRLFSNTRNAASIQELALQLNHTLQRYIRAKVLLGIFSLLYSTAIMLVLGVPHAFALGILAGILEFIPVAGWMIAAASIVGFSVIVHAHWIWVLALLGLWRILMDYWISPRIMGRELEIHPLLALFTMMVGGTIGGIAGVYLSVPIIAVLRVCARVLLAHKSRVAVEAAGPSALPAPLAGEVSNA